MAIDRRKKNCWETFKCKRRDCPAFKHRDVTCWLEGSEYCHESIEGTWLEKMEACLPCPVFRQNFELSDWAETFDALARQYREYRETMEAKQRELEEKQQKLEKFKMTSIHLLRELEQKSQELESERDLLEQRVDERTRELRQTQAQLIQSTKMAAIGRFSAGIAHEINNPLGAIINFARTLLGNPELKEQNRGYVELILKGLFRIENVVKQVLLHTVKAKGELASTDIHAVIHETLAFTRHKLEEKQIQIRLDFDETLPPLLLEAAQIQQVFTNIVHNAIDAMGTGGRLMIRSRRGKMVRIQFIDNGDGIAPDNLDQLCDPFFTTKEVGRGTGLGLFICYRILQFYDGNLTIKSKEGKGTQVVVELPLPEEMS